MCKNSTRYNRTRNFGLCGDVEGKKTEKFVFRSALRPNQISFSHNQDPIRTLADCDASRFEEDILPTWYRYQPAKRPFMPELPGGRSARLPKFGTPFGREGKPQGCRPLCKFGIEKDVERSDLATANNDDIQSGVVRALAFRA
jgi:hypothetical protein